MYKILVFLTTVVSFILLGCTSGKTWLSIEIKEVNPYHNGQKLTFTSNLGVENTIVIADIRDAQFPDGMGAFLNERLFVSAFRPSKTIRGGTEKRILTIFAKTDKYEEEINFSISLKDTYLKMKPVVFTDYKKLTIINLDTDYQSYNDVLRFKNYPDRKFFDNEIVEFYWSKSSGYVRLIQNNGVVWDLKSAE